MFTGHRPQNLPFGFNEYDSRCLKLRELLRQQIYEKVRFQKIKIFLTGMALGTDTFAAEIVLELKKKLADISLVAVLPCASQTLKWRKEDVIRYEKLLKRCDDVVLVQQQYTHDCMNRRNKYMVEHSDCVIAVWNGTGGGTGNTIKFAIERKLPVTVLAPDTLEVYQL